MDGERQAGTILVMNRGRGERERLGVLAAAGAAFAAMAFQLVPSNTARAGILALAPLVAWLASPDVIANGGCPNCYARRRRQKRVEAGTRVDTASRATTHKEKVQIDIGWDVSVDSLVTCTKCGTERRTTDTQFISAHEAATVAEALVLGRRA